MIPHILLGQYNEKSAYGSVILILGGTYRVISRVLEISRGSNLAFLTSRIFIMISSSVRFFDFFLIEFIGASSSVPHKPSIYKQVKSSQAKPNQIGLFEAQIKSNPDPA